MIEATPAGGTAKKGSDRGVDGLITFTNESGKLETVLVSVKSGHVTSSQVRDLKGTIERDHAAMGIFITLEPPSREMKLEAATSGLYHSTLWNRDYPKVQILSIAELLAGKRPDVPAFKSPTYQRAPRIRTTVDQGSLFAFPTLEVADAGSAAEALDDDVDS